MDVPADHADADLEVSLQRVKLRNFSGHGLWIEDGVADDGSDGSEASIKLTTHRSSLKDNGMDGIHVDERKRGYVWAKIEDSEFKDNGGNGLAIDEAGGGEVEVGSEDQEAGAAQLDPSDLSPADAYVEVSDSDFTGNGYATTTDPEDGIDIREADGGRLTVKIEDVESSSNAESGVDLKEFGLGSLIAYIEDVTTEENGKMDGAAPASGINVLEHDSGALQAYLDDVTSDNNGGDGFHISEDEDQNEEVEDEEPASQGGPLTVHITKASASWNGDRGVSLSEQSQGAVDFEATRLTANNNLDGEGVEVLEFDGGELGAVLNRVVANGNDDHGIDLVDDLSEDDSDPDGGAITARFSHVTASRNAGSGAFLNEGGPGAIDATMSWMTVEDNEDQGVHLSEDEEGPVSAELTFISARGGRNYGILVQEAGTGGVQVTGEWLRASENEDWGLGIEERHGGDADVQVSLSRFEENGQDGARVQESDAGRLDLTVNRTAADDNAGDGWDILEAGGGDLAAAYTDSSADDNEEYGIRAQEQDDGTGTLSLIDTSLEDNGLGETLLTGVVLTP